MVHSKTAKASKNSSANIGFEAKLWLAADKLRSNMDAAEYKHVVLGLIFLKYISDSFEEHHAKLKEGKGDYAGSNPEDPDEYRAENIFWVPPAARWTYLQNSASSQRSARSLMTRWSRSSAITRDLKASCRKITRAPRSIRIG
jgi:type I restriction enzyme M protein